MDGGNLKRGGKYKSRPHYKSEKREQRKAWRKRKREKALLVPPTEDGIGGKSVEVPAKRARKEECGGSQKISKPLTRGSLMVQLAMRKPQRDKKGAMACSPERETQVHTKSKTAAKIKVAAIPEINPDLLTAQPCSGVGCGTFGECYLATYRAQYSVLVKELKMGEKPNAERTKQELFREAHVLMSLGDHERLPHLFGICSGNSPYRLILQFHNVNNESVTMTKAAADMELNFHQRLGIIKGVAATLHHIHQKGYLHNDLKGNNVVIEKSTQNGTFRPIVIDFGKSVKIKDARLKKPKVNIERAGRRFPHIAPEVLRGSKQTPASDVYAFGKLIQKFVSGCDSGDKFCSLIKKTTDLNPLRRITLEQITNLLDRL